MTEGNFEPLRVLAELNALGVRYVLVGDLAEEAPGPPLTSDRVEICVADDEDDIERLRMLLVALEAEQAEAGADPHRAAFRTKAGLLECLEMPADGEYGELERRARHVDFGNGIIARAISSDEVAVRHQDVVVHRAEVVMPPLDPGELIETVRAAAVAAPAEEDPPEARRPRHRDEDEYGPDPRVSSEPLKPWQRVWKAFEDIDDFLTNLDAKSLPRPRVRRR